MLLGSTKEFFNRGWFYTTYHNMILDTRDNMIIINYRGEFNGAAVPSARKTCTLDFFDRFRQHPPLMLTKMKSIEMTSEFYGFLCFYGSFLPGPEL
jgi:hypothetical protein